MSYDDTSGTTHEVFPIHSFDTSEHGIYQNDADVCYDFARLDVRQTQFSPDIVFTMRSFRFNVPGSDPNAVQQQSISLQQKPKVDQVDNSELQQSVIWLQ